MIPLKVGQLKSAQLIHRNRSLILSFYRFKPNLAMNMTLYNFLTGIISWCYLWTWNLCESRLSPTEWGLHQVLNLEQTSRLFSEHFLWICNQTDLRKTAKYHCSKTENSYLKIKGSFSFSKLNMFYVSDRTLSQFTLKRTNHILKLFSVNIWESQMFYYFVV